MRQIASYILSVFLAAHAACAIACGDGTPVNSCSVVVEKDSFVAYFPVLKPQAEWHWRTSNSADNAMEYRWKVALGECKDSGDFKALEYSFGVELFKFPGQNEGTGDLNQLLAKAQSDVMRSSPSDRGTRYERLSQFRVSATSYVPATIQVGSRQKEALDVLFASKPGYAFMTADTLDAEQSYTCLAPVQYR